MRLWWWLRREGWSRLRQAPTLLDRSRRRGRMLSDEPQSDGVHTIPVPHGWTPEQAWEAIRRGDLLTDPEPWWANVLIRNGRFVELFDA